MPLEGGGVEFDICHAKELVGLLLIEMKLANIGVSYAVEAASGSRLGDDQLRELLGIHEIKVVMLKVASIAVISESSDEKGVHKSYAKVRVLSLSIVESKVVISVLSMER